MEKYNNDDYSDLCVVFFADHGSLGGGGMTAFYKNKRNVIKRDIELKNIDQICKIFSPLKLSIHKLNNKEYLIPSFWKDNDIIDKHWIFYNLEGGSNCLFVRDCYNNKIKECVSNLKPFNIINLLNTINNVLK